MVHIPLDILTKFRVRHQPAPSPAATASDTPGNRTAAQQLLPKQFISSVANCCSNTS